MILFHASKGTANMCIGLATEAGRAPGTLYSCMNYFSQVLQVNGSLTANILYMLIQNGVTAGKNNTLSNK